MRNKDRYTRNPTDKEILEASAKYVAKSMGFGDMAKGGDRAPQGFSPIKGSSKGGYHKKEGNRYIYWYPGQGITSSPHADDEGKPKGKPAARGGANGRNGKDDGKTRQVITDPSKLPKGFNDLDKKQRAVMTADYGVVQEGMKERFGEPKKYSPNDVKGEVTKHIDEMATQGYIIPSNADRAKKMLHAMIDHAEAAGVDKKKVADLMEENVRKLAHQEVESISRTLGDHGVRHLSVNAAQSDKIFDQLEKGGVNVSPLDRMMAYQVWIDHDLGYAIPAIARGGFAVKDNYHPQASAVMSLQQKDKLSGVFGEKGFDTYVRAVANHSGTEVDWKSDAFGSAVRLADNTHLFADKMPEVLFDNDSAVRAMVKIRIASEYIAPTVEVEGKKKRSPEDKAKFKGLIGRIRNDLLKQIASRDDLPQHSKDALSHAAQEIGELTPKFLISRLAGRSPNFDFDGKNMNVKIEQSEARETIGEVFGMDEEDKQFVKLLKDYGTSPDKALASPPPKIHIGDENNGIQFEWDPPSGENHVEHRHAAIMKEARAEWDRIQKMDGEEKDAAMSKFFGPEVAKAMRALGALGRGAFGVVRTSFDDAVADALAKSDDGFSVAKGNIYQGEAIHVDDNEQERRRINAAMLVDDRVPFGGSGGIPEWFVGSDVVQYDDNDNVNILDDSDPRVRRELNRLD